MEVEGRVIEVTERWSFDTRSLNGAEEGSSWRQVVASWSASEKCPRAWWAMALRWKALTDLGSMSIATVASISASRKCSSLRCAIDLLANRIAF